ncbi:hypothetical protein IEQ44_12505 [Nocardioides sp. Y6]|uniref:GerMN domain-containing protein n=2 Tax=Nocardioides malaquae TaxID=2773426 RepID=A0ABR9RVC9_9ACTN|nr:hypothetical protein [Nocardioides malaquae]
MKKLWTSLCAALTALLLALALGGCSGGGDGGSAEDPEPEQKSPQEVAMLYVDAFRGGDGLTSYNENSSWDGSYFESLGNSAPEVVGEPLTSEQAAEVATAYERALGQVKAEVVDEKVDGDTATVTLAVRGLAYGDAMESAAKDWTLDDKDPAGSYASLVLEALDVVKPVKKPMRVTMTLTQGGDGLWAPDGDSGAALTRALLR